MALSPLGMGVSKGVASHEQMAGVKSGGSTPTADVADLVLAWRSGASKIALRQNSNAVSGSENSIHSCRATCRRRLLMQILRSTCQLLLHKASVVEELPSHRSRSSDMQGFCGRSPNHSPELGATCDQNTIGHSLTLVSGAVGAILG